MDWTYKDIITYILLPALAGILIHELIVAGPKRRKRKQERETREVEEDQL